MQLSSHVTAPTPEGYSPHSHSPAATACYPKPCPSLKCVMPARCPYSAAAPLLPMQATCHIQMVLPLCSWLLLKQLPQPGVHDASALPRRCCPPSVAQAAEAPRQATAANLRPSHPTPQRCAR